MKINKQHGKYNITPRTAGIQYIVVHYTGDGTSKAGSAKNNCIYFGTGNRNASAHYFIDDSGIWEYADPKTYATWHCGDGHGKYGITNANSIGIEVCMGGDLPYTTAEITYLTELVMSLMYNFGVKASNVVRHYDASGKLCPLYYAKRPSEWNKLRERITGTSKTKHGWIQEYGEWHYYKNGKKQKSTWAKDSKGWCYLNTSGKITKSKWVKSKGEWYYLNADGYMAVNEWAKDSTDKWCYLGEDGKMVKRRWIKWKNEWYYMDADGYMVANGWAQDTHGWCYLGPNGKIVKSAWLRWKDNWYYLKKDGYMATGVTEIDGKSYAFDLTGKLVGEREA